MGNQAGAVTKGPDFSWNQPGSRPRHQVRRVFGNCWLMPFFSKSGYNPALSLDQQITKITASTRPCQMEGFKATKLA